MARSSRFDAGGPGFPTSPAVPPPWWPTLLASSFVLACLTALAAIPIWASSRISVLRTEIQVVAEPAHPLATRLQYMYARQAASIRGYLLTAEDTHTVRVREARAHEEEILFQLEPLVHRLDPSLVGNLDAVRALAGTWHALQDSLLAQLITAEQYVARMSAQRQLYRLLLDESERLNQALFRETERRRREIIAIERRNFALSAVLAIAALGAALLVTWLARRERLFAFENARLYRESRRAAERWRFLADASSILSAFLDYSLTLRSIARLAVPRIADWCVLDVFSEQDGSSVERVATAHADPKKELLLEEMRRRQPLDSTSMQPAAQALRSGEPFLLPRITPAELEASVEDPEQISLLHELGTNSLIAVPLVARGQTIGAMTFVSALPDLSYDSDDVELVAALAGRAALAVDNARLYDAAMAGNRTKTNFLAIVSHELRTPLTAVVGYAELLELAVAGPLTAKQVEQVRRIKASAYHLLDLIDEILAFSRLEAASEEVQLRWVDPVEIVRDSVVVVEPMAAQKELSISTELPETPVQVETDPLKVRRILVNLLTNAVKFTERGRIVLNAEVEDGAVTFRVTDTGIGIAREQLEGIFEPFWQVEDARTRRVGGLGLGLSLARRYTNLLSGEITVDSGLGRGSTFTVRLPARARPLS